MRSSLDLRRGLAVSAVAIFLTTGSGPAAAQGGHPGEGVMPPGDAMSTNHEMTMDHEGGGPGAAKPEGDVSGVHQGHGMPDMETMGSIAANVHEVHLAATQRVLAHKTTIHALLVALGIDRERNSALLRQAQSQFEHVHAGLRDGDPAHGLEGIADMSVRVKLQEVHIYWSRYDAVIAQILSQWRVTAEQITMLTETDADLQRSLKAMAEAVERHSYAGRGSSILLPTVRHAQHLSATLQQLSAAFLLVAHGHDIAASELALRQTAAEFDTVLEALIQGDHELHVLGAPTPEILAQYARVREKWQQCWSAIEQVPAGRRSDPGMIDSVLTQVEQVAAEVEMAVGLYHYL